MSPEEKARLVIDEQLEKSGWIIQDMKELNLAAGRGVLFENIRLAVARWTMPFL